MKQRLVLVSMTFLLLTSSSPVGAQVFFLDHYNVYDVTFGTIPPVAAVSLKDQFGDRVTGLREPRLFMVPALKNQEDLNDPFGHLTCYTATDPAPPGPDVVVTNQFGEQTLTLGESDLLCVPTIKLIAPGSSNLGHYQCYQATGQPIDTQVLINDQFQAQSAVLLDPRLLCNPVDKNGEGIGNPVDHLTCYGYVPSGVPPGPVPILNQFFPDQDLLDVASPNMLCVPSLKQPVGPEPVDHFSVYRANGPPGVPVTVTDQFGTETVDPGPLDLFMVPANKNGEGLFDPISHLSCHALPGGQPAPPKVIVANQFGEFVIDLGVPRELCLPTEKLITPGPVTIDHFKCYDASGPSVDVDVDWVDQFQGIGVRVLDPFMLCNPADKNGEGIGNPDEHLLCYNTTPPGSPVGPIDVVSQFNQGGPIDVAEPFALCVPSSKTVPQNPVPVLQLGPALLAAGLIALGALAGLARTRGRSKVGG